MSTSQRNQIYDDFQASSVRANGAFWTDAAVERMWQAWIAAGRPAGVAVQLSNRGGKERVDIFLPETITD